MVKNDRVKIACILSNGNTMDILKSLRTPVNIAEKKPLDMRFL